MKIFIYVFCFAFITIGYTSAADTDDKIPVEVVADATDDSSSVSPEIVSEEPEIKEEIPSSTVASNPVRKTPELPKKRQPVQSRRIKSDERRVTTSTTTTAKPVEKRVIEEPIEKPVEKSIEKSAPRTNPVPVADRGSGKFTENVIHSISSGPDDYSFSFKTEEGHNRDESVHIDRTGKSANDNDDDLGSVSAKGSYSFISADGFEYTVDYVADGKGYHPKVNVRKL